MEGRATTQKYVEGKRVLGEGGRRCLTAKEALDESEDIDAVALIGAAISEIAKKEDDNKLNRSDKKQKVRSEDVG